MYFILINWNKDLKSIVLARFLSEMRSGTKSLRNSTRLTGNDVLQGQPVSQLFRENREECPPLPPHRYRNLVQLRWAQEPLTGIE